MKQQQVKDVFVKEYGSSFRFFAAPGRINLIGEHTDYNDGFVLPAAIDKRIYLAITPVDGPTTSITAVDINKKVSFETLADGVQLPQWARYPYGVIGEMRKAGHHPGSFHAAFGGDIPSGAGLSSSAALESVFAFALNELFSLGLDRFTLAKIGQKAEHNYVGVRCGIMDQFSSVFGKKDHVFRLDCRSLDYEYFPLVLDGYELILADTQVKHSLASSEYNTRRAQCEEGVMIMASEMPQVHSLRDVDNMDVMAFAGIMGEEIAMRCQYVTEENDRVLQTCDALANGDMEEVGKLLYKSHHGLSNLYMVSCAELDLLVDTAKTIDGVMGARMMGGGFGGCTINLIRSSAVETFKQKTSETYQEAFGIKPIYYDVHIGDGVREL
jgi:galactokinase